MLLSLFRTAPSFPPRSLLGPLALLGLHCSLVVALLLMCVRGETELLLRVLTLFLPPRGAT